MRELFKYYFKKRIHIIGILSIIIIVFAFIFLGSQYVIQWELDGVIHKNPMNNPIPFHSIMALILVTIIPMFEFSFKMKKVGVDHFYSFPIKREKLLLTKFIIGFIEVLLPFLSGVLYSLLSIILNEHIFHLEYYFIFILISIPSLFAIYSMVTLIYSKCNTIADGIIMIALLIFVFSPIYSLVEEIIKATTSGGYISPNSISILTLYGPYTYLSDCYLSLMNGSITLKFSPLNIGFAIVYFILGIASFFVLIYTSKSEKAENSMDISSSWFSYKVFIPILMTLFIGVSEVISLIIFLIIVGYIGYVIYRRSFKIKWYDWIVLGASVHIGLLINYFVDVKTIFY